jgi:anthranilate synthase component 1
VADSVPVLEWEETINKRRAMFRAVAWAEAGLNGAQDADQVAMRLPPTLS